MTETKEAAFTETATHAFTHTHTHCTLPSPTQTLIQPDSVDMHVHTQTEFVLCRFDELRCTRLPPPYMVKALLREFVAANATLLNRHKLDTVV